MSWCIYSLTENQCLACILLSVVKSWLQMAVYPCPYSRFRKHYFIQVIEIESKKGSAKELMLMDTACSNNNSCGVCFCLQLHWKNYLELNRNAIMLSPHSSNISELMIFPHMHKWEGKGSVMWCLKMCHCCLWWFHHLNS